MQFQSIFRIGLLACCGLGCGSCDNPNAAETRYDRIASAYCECTAALVALNLKAQSLPADSAGHANLNAYLQQMQTEYNKAKECSATIVAQFGLLNAADLEAVDKALTHKCPDLATQRELLREMLGE